MKLSWNLFNQICEPKNRFTAKEIDMLLYLTQKQDDFGMVPVIHRKEIVAATGMKLQSYYNTMESLTERGIIETETYLPDGSKNDYGYRNIRIVANNFTDASGNVTKESIKAAGGYFDLDKYSCVNTPIFYGLTPSEKRVVLYMLKLHGYYVQNRIKGNLIVTRHTIKTITGKKHSAKKFARTIYNSGLLPVTLTDDFDLLWKHSDIITYDGIMSKESQENRRNDRIVSILLKAKGITATIAEITEALNIMGRQYAIRASAAVQWIIVNCIYARKIICPRYINAKCQELKVLGPIKDMWNGYLINAHKNAT